MANQYLEFDLSSDVGIFGSTKSPATFKDDSTVTIYTGPYSGTGQKTVYARDVNIETGSVSTAFTYDYTGLASPTISASPNSRYIVFCSYSGSDGYYGLYDRNSSSWVLPVQHRMTSATIFGNSPPTGRVSNNGYLVGQYPEPVSSMGSTVVGGVFFEHLLGGPVTTTSMGQGSSVTTTRKNPTGPLTFTDNDDAVFYGYDFEGAGFVTCGGWSTNGSAATTSESSGSDVLPNDYEASVLNNGELFYYRSGALGTLCSMTLGTADGENTLSGDTTIGLYPFFVGSTMYVPITSGGQTKIWIGTYNGTTFTKTGESIWYSSATMNSTRIYNNTVRRLASGEIVWSWYNGTFQNTNNVLSVLKWNPDDDNFTIHHEPSGSVTGFSPTSSGVIQQSPIEQINGSVVGLGGYEVRGGVLNRLSSQYLTAYEPWAAQTITGLPANFVGALRSPAQMVNDTTLRVAGYDSSYTTGYVVEIDIPTLAATTLSSFSLNNSNGFIHDTSAEAHVHPGGDYVTFIYYSYSAATLSTASNDMFASRYQISTDTWHDTNALVSNDAFVRAFFLGCGANGVSALYYTDNVPTMGSDVATEAGTFSHSTGSQAAWEALIPISTNSTGITPSPGGLGSGVPGIAYQWSANHIVCYGGTGTYGGGQAVWDLNWNGSNSYTRWNNTYGRRRIVSYYPASIVYDPNQTRTSAITWVDTNGSIYGGEFWGSSNSYLAVPGANGFTTPLPVSNGESCIYVDYSATEGLRIGTYTFDGDAPYVTPTHNGFKSVWSKTFLDKGITRADIYAQHFAFKGSNSRYFWGAFDAGASELRIVEWADGDVWDYLEPVSEVSGGVSGVGGYSVSGTMEALTEAGELNGAVSNPISSVSGFVINSPLAPGEIEGFLTASSPVALGLMINGLLPGEMEGNLTGYSGIVVSGELSQDESLFGSLVVSSPQMAGNLKLSVNNVLAEYLHYFATINGIRYPLTSIVIQNSGVISSGVYGQAVKLTFAPSKELFNLLKTNPSPLVGVQSARSIGGVVSIDPIVSGTMQAISYSVSKPTIGIFETQYFNVSNQTIDRPDLIVIGTNSGRVPMDLRIRPGDTLTGIGSPKTVSTVTHYIYSNGSALTEIFF